ncbi:MAG: hypothetical protein MJZ30_05820 [Paludibacteraceae bacterium]|nr:hypothetical protein [Paludibacteraceae bacterium]
MKRVSHSVAKALKEAGYPQGITRDVYVIKEDGRTCIEYPIGVCISSSVALPQDYIADIPTYLGAWLWLWREKGIAIDTVSYSSKAEVQIWRTDDTPICDSFGQYDGPEEAIEKAIEYLVNNNLIN